MNIGAKITRNSDPSFDHFARLTNNVSQQRPSIYKMLDVNDFITERGGNPNKIRESQRRRHAPEEAVDEVIAMFEDHRQSRLRPRAVQICINRY